MALIEIEKKRSRPLSSAIIYYGYYNWIPFDIVIVTGSRYSGHQVPFYNQIGGSIFFFTFSRVFGLFNLTP